MNLFPWLLFLHVLAAIIAFGPGFAQPLIGQLTAQEPQHGNFVARANLFTIDRLILPAALSLPVTGALMIIVAGYDLLATRWLLVAIVLYVIAISIAVFLQRPAIQRLIALTSGPPPAGAPPGPPAGVPETAAAVRRNGAILGILVVTIVLLMVVKPTF
jgi:uncharacterized membrane protein